MASGVDPVRRAQCALIAACESVGAAVERFPTSRRDPAPEGAFRRR